jgi:glutamate transport system permease protein
MDTRLRSAGSPEGAMSDFLSSDGHKILLAFWMTLKVSALSAAGSLVFGTVLAAMRVAPLPVLRTVGTLYVNVLRNTPLTLIILFCGLGLGSIVTVADVQTTNYFWLAVFGLVAYTSAFVCEVLRAGVNTVPFGQAEAARSIGLNFTQTLRIVVLPQAFRAVIAPLGSVLIALIKNTTIAAAIGVPEAFYTMRNQLQSHGDIVIPIFAGYALFFVALTLPVGLIFGWLAKRWAVDR